MTAETVTNAADTAGDAAMLEAWRKLSSTQRNLLCRAIDAMLSGPGAKSPAFPPDTRRALLEAQMMSEAIDTIVCNGLPDGVLDFPMLQAIRACLMRMDAAVDPAIERMQAEENHV